MTILAGLGQDVEVTVQVQPRRDGGRVIVTRRSGAVVAASIRLSRKHRTRRPFRMQPLRYFFLARFTELIRDYTALELSVYEHPH
jgi:hypothetical protein